jgi:hypothetical protein
MISPNQVLIIIKGVSWVLDVTPNGFPNQSIDVAYYTTSDCSGTPYLVGCPEPNSLLTFRGQCGTVFNDVLYYGGAQQQVTALSFGNLPDPTGPATNCQGPIANPSPKSGVPLNQTFDLSTLGFTPPFHVQ